MAAEGGGVVVAFWDGILLELRESWWLMLDGSGGAMMCVYAILWCFLGEGVFLVLMKTS